MRLLIISPRRRVGEGGSPLFPLPESMMTAYPMPLLCCWQVLKLAALAICYATRLGQLNRALTDTRKLRAMVRDLHRQPLAMAADLRMRVSQRVDNLIANLAAERHYMHPQTRDYDPRFLVFEFVSGGSPSTMGLGSGGKAGERREVGTHHSLSRWLVVLGRCRCGTSCCARASWR